MKKVTGLCLVLVLNTGMNPLKSQHMQKQFTHEVEIAINNSKSVSGKLLAENDLEHLPTQVQKYIRYTRSVGKPIPQNVHILAKGRICSEPGKWMHFTSNQYNVFHNPFRAFYIKARKLGIPATGLHLFKNGTAFMRIKLLSLFEIVNAQGPEMDQSETVTFFNDLCFMAPARLTDKNISWETIDSLHVKAYFTSNSKTISAILTFESDGRLVDFISYNRYQTINGKDYVNYPWKTPVNEYRNFNGYRLPYKAKAIYERPEGDFCYLEFEMLGISYNCLF